MSERMQVSTRAELHDNAREMLYFEIRVESRQERVVQHLEDPLFGLSPLTFLFQSQSFLVHHFHGVEAVITVQIMARVGTFELTQIDGPDVPASNPADELEVSESKARFPAKCSGTYGFVGRFGRTVRL